MSYVRLAGVHKRYRDVRALQGLDLDIERGEFFCLFGPSAAGKTTTLRIIAGLTRPDEGTVHCADRNVTFDPVQGRDVAMVFQTFALYPHLSVFANLAYPLREAGLSRAEIRQRVGETAEMLRVTHTLPRKPETLSGGEQQRVAIGRALVRRPSLLLLDEPLTNLDAKLRHDTRVEFKRLHRELDMTLVYASPDQLEALSMGERIAVLNEGAVVQVGTPDSLYDAPQDSYIGTMLGAPAMNLVAGKAGSSADVELPFLAVDGARWQGAIDSATDVLLGIRPQALRPSGAGNGPTFDASVHLTEPLGDVTVVDLDASGTPLKMVLSESEAFGLKVGDRMNIELDVGQTHLFFRETGIRIAPHGAT